jgi:hypothetical protein
VGEASLLLELIDSVSNRVLVRAVDRQAATRPGSQMQRSNPVTNWSDVRNLARRWARQLRDDLDELTTAASSLR